VVGIGAICDLHAGRADDARTQSFSVSEFVTLDDGRRVTLHAERGFSIGIRSTGPPVPRDVRLGLTLDDLTRDVLTVVRPDGHPVDEHPWSWLAGLARARGLSVGEGDLRALTYEVVVTDAVRRWLRGSPEPPTEDTSDGT
jgi:hypothetical protein